MNLRDFIENRKLEIKAQIATLRGELRELNIAEAALRSATGGNSATIATPSSKTTIKEKVLQVLQNKPTGADSSEILLEIQSIFNETIERTSLSPQLSRLKDEGRVVFDGKTWKLPENKSDLVDNSTKSDLNSRSSVNEPHVKNLPRMSLDSEIPTSSKPTGTETASWNIDDEIPF